MTVQGGPPFGREERVFELEVERLGEFAYLAESVGDSAAMKNGRPLFPEVLPREFNSIGGIVYPHVKVRIVNIDIGSYFVVGCSKNEANGVGWWFPTFRQERNMFVNVGYDC